MSDTKLQVIIGARDDASTTLNKFKQHAESTLSRVSDSVKTYSKIASAGFLAATGYAIKSSADMQMLRTSLDTLTGSTEKGSALFQDLYKFAAKTPFETSGLAKATQTMLSFGIANEKVMPYLQMLGDVSMGNNDKLQGLALAFGQVQSTGRLMGQDLLQMINNGFNPLTVISQKTGKSMTELKKDMEAGAISAEMVAEAFKSATSEGGLFYQGMERGSRTFSGVMSTLRDNVSMVAMGMVGLSETGEVVKGGLFDKISQAASAVSSYLEENREKIVTYTNDLVAAGIRWVNEVAIPWIQQYWPAIKAVVSGAWDVIRGLYDLLNGPFGVAVLAVVTALVAYQKTVTAVRIATEAWTIIQAVLNGTLMFNPIGLVIAAVAGLTIVIIEIVKHWKEVVEWLKRAWEWFSRLAPVVSALLGPLNSVASVLAKIIGNWNSIAKSGGASNILKGIFGVSGRAEGGPVTANRPYWVGEKGTPELFVPRQSGTIVPQEKLAGGVTVNIYGNINNNEGLTPEELAKVISREFTLSQNGAF